MRVNSTDLQNAFGKYLSLCEKEDIIITKNGKNVAKLISYRKPEEYLLNETKGDYNVKQRISFAEYEDGVNTSDQRYELIKGEIYLLTSPSFRHQVVLREIFRNLVACFHNHTCQVLSAPFDIRLKGYAEKFSEDPNVIQPDLVVICDEENVTEDGRYEGIPTLIVEILSSSTRGKDMISKLDLYMRSGIREYWIVDPIGGQFWQYAFSIEREPEDVHVFEKTGTVESVSFPGLVLDLATIFPVQKQG